jgi:hypothetical protein
LFVHDSVFDIVKVEILRLCVLLLLSFSCLKSDIDTAMDSNSDPDAQSFIELAEGRWSLLESDLLPERTTCSISEDYVETIESSVLRKEFVLRNETPLSFSIISLEEDNLISCERQTSNSEFTCTQDTFTVWLLDIESADIEMLVYSVAKGQIISEQQMVIEYDLELTCLHVDHWFGLDCGDIETFFSTPCTISFSTQAQYIQ